MAALNWEGWLTIAVVVATLAMLLWERFTPDKVLIGAAAVLMASGVLAPKEALAGFWNPGGLTVENGRASGRGRGWQEVLVAGVAGSFNKKRDKEKRTDN